MSENETLSEREREVLRLVATGASNKEIAQQLAISTNTVKVHLRNIFAKTGVVSRTEATLYAIRQGLAQVPSRPGLTPLPMQAPVPLPVIAPEKRVPRPAWHYVLISVPILVLAAISLTLLARRSPDSASASPAAPNAPSRWETRATLPAARSGLAAAFYDNHIYAIGGQTAEGVSDLTERYDLARNAWTTLSPKPLPVTDVAAAVVGGKIYVPGGRLASGQVTDALEVYDPQRDQWNRRASLPTALAAYALVAFEGKLYVFGGWDGQRVLSVVYEYAPDKDTWSLKSAMAVAREYAGAVVAANRIYVIGGYDGTKSLSLNEEFSPERDDGYDKPWISRAAMPEGRYAMGLASIAGIVYLVGGQDGSEKGLIPLEYFAQLDKWQTFESPPVEAWSHLTFVPTETLLFALGGQIRGAPTDKNIAYEAVYTIMLPSVR